MRKFFSALVLGAAVGLSFVPFASADLIQARGGIKTAEGSISGSGEEIVAINVMCTGTACHAALYDSDGTGSITNSDGIYEAGAAANESSFVKFDVPIRTTDGVYLVLDGNVNGVVVYTRKLTP